MTDPFKDFNRDFKRSERMFNAGFAIVFVLIIVVFIAMIVSIGFVAYELSRLGDDGIARELGHFVAVFRQAMEGK